MTSELPIYVKNYTTEEKALAEHLINLEKKALDKFFKGDMSGYKKLWSQKSFSYFDAVVTERVDDYPKILKFLDSLEGKLYAENYEFKNPRVQVTSDMAILTYQLFAKTNFLDVEYNAIEVFQKFDEEWEVVHSTWSFIRPMDKEFPEIVV